VMLNRWLFFFARGDWVRGSPRFFKQRGHSLNGKTLDGVERF
jgi:hypothetical protein